MKLFVDKPYELEEKIMIWVSMLSEGPKRGQQQHKMDAIRLQLSDNVPMEQDEETSLKKKKKKKKKKKQLVFTLFSNVDNQHATWTNQ